MRKLLPLTLGLLVAAAASASAQSPRQNSFEQIERGRYLSVLGDCAACHTTPGGKPLAGGVAIDTPFGRLVGANITPDVETGVGKYSEEDFQRVMAEGLGKGGYHLYGAMPFTAYTKVSKEDNSAIWAYLQTIEPVHHKVETNQLPFPFDVRASLAGWNMLNFTPGEFKLDGTKTPEWNRGAYIVQGLGHCGTCHTPKSFLGGDKNGEFLEGSILGDWYAPNITSDPHKGLGSWSKEDIVAYLKTGTNRFDIASGPMSEEVSNSSQHWTDADLNAVATYLKDVGKTTTAASSPIGADDNRMVAGKAIYADRCSACHVASGEGNPGLFPRLANAPLVNSDDATSLIHVVLAGSQAGATKAAPTGPDMPSFAWNLNDNDVANVLTYVRNSWGNAASAVAPGDVESLRRGLTK